MIDLAAERVGGKALLASDEFFAEKENLLKSGRGIFIPDKYTDRGKWMDGWESRRKRAPGHDWCIIKLGLPGIVKAVDIDTNHFLGNHPPFASMDGANPAGGIPVDDLPNSATLWTEFLPKAALNPGSQNIFEIASTQRWTHIRLNIYPDGGVARLRIYGNVIPDWSNYKANDLVDLAAVENGGVVIGTSDMFFGSGQNMIMPGSAATMGDGWETKPRT
jgi:allantoicase